MTRVWILHRYTMTQQYGVVQGVRIAEPESANRQTHKAASRVHQCAPICWLNSLKHRNAPCLLFACRRCLARAATCSAKPGTVARQPGSAGARALLERRARPGVFTPCTIAGLRRADVPVDKTAPRPHNHALARRRAQARAQHGCRQRAGDAQEASGGSVEAASQPVLRGLPEPLCVRRRRVAKPPEGVLTVAARA